MASDIPIEVAHLFGFAFAMLLYGEPWAGTERAKVKVDDVSVLFQGYTFVFSP